jgi:hypothetical protein
MNKSILTMMIFLALSGSVLFGQKGKDKLALKADTVGMDTIKYELIIIDPGFESWLLTKPSINFYSQWFYESKNKLFVTEWNNRYMQPHRYGSLYEDYINYRPEIDYGTELNYRLYYYFLYFEEKNHVSLLPGKNKSRR